MLTYKGEELNHTLKLNKLQYLVVGTGRCGTVYMAKLLSSVGIPCSHEGVFSIDGLDHALAIISGEQSIKVSHISKLASEVDEKKGISWFDGNYDIIADSSYMAVPFLDHDCLKDTKIIHVIRHPMEVINSFVEGFKYFMDESLEDSASKLYHEFIYSYLPMLKEKMDPLTRAAMYYVEWNKLIEKACKTHQHFVHRIEYPIDKLLFFLDKTGQSYYNNKESNHKIGLRFKHKSFDSISMPIREQLELIYNKYYNPHNRM